jgi:enterochelin esterase-like enzyme
VLCESGAFGADHPDHRLYHRSVIEDLIDHLAPPPLTLWLDCGLHEWFLAPNRQMAARLLARGYAVSYWEQRSGHNYPSWRNVLWRGLMHLYGPYPHEA